MERKSGVLLSLTSLPSRFGIGDLGPEAFKFADFMRKAGQTVWQVLPLNVTNGGSGNSPYSPLSAFAGNPLLISPETLATQGLLDESALRDAVIPPDSKVAYDNVTLNKRKLLQAAFDKFQKVAPRDDYERFYEENRSWLEPYSFFAAIKEAHDGSSWQTWPSELKYKQHDAMQLVWRELQDKIEYHRFVQYLFHAQISALRVQLGLQRIELVGDMPIYMTLDSADVWANPQLFELDEQLKPVSVAGVPPDYYSKTGQLWGNPLYRWDAMQADGFKWWMERLRHMLRFFDKVRIDHFRGLIGYWSLPADAATAEHGCWRSVPHESFFAQLCLNFPEHPFWAENLGILTPEIEDARGGMGLPGMLVLHFAFSDPARNPYIPHNHSRNNIVYTGTHDNNTSRGWFTQEASADEKENLGFYLGKKVSAETVCDDMVRMALASVAETAVVQMQDYLQLGAECRMNIPSTPSGNWEWRMLPGQTSDALASEIRRMAAIYGRLPSYCRG